MATIFASVPLLPDLYVGLLFCQSDDLVTYSGLHNQIFLNEEGYFIKTQYPDYGSFLELLDGFMPVCKNRLNLVCITDDKMTIKNIAFEGVANKNNIGMLQYPPLRERNIENIKKATKIFLGIVQSIGSKENRSLSDYFAELDRDYLNQADWKTVHRTDAAKIYYRSTINDA